MTPEQVAWLATLQRLLDAGMKLVEHTERWPNDAPDYPAYLPSFDQFVSDMLNFRDSVEQHWRDA